MKYLALKVAKLDFRAVRAANSYGHRAPTNGTLSVNICFALLVKRVIHPYTA